MVRRSNRCRSRRLIVPPAAAGCKPGQSVHDGRMPAGRRDQTVRAQTTILSLLLVLGSSVETAPPQERTALEGTWLVTSLSLNGQVYSGGGTEIGITIAGNTYEQSVNGQVNERGTITVDPSMIPMRIDFLIIEPAQTTTQLGIV